MFWAVFRKEQGVNRLKIASFRYLARLLLSFLRQRNSCARFGKLKMSKTGNIIDFLQAGIKAEGLRQKAITNNIANLQTPGYRRFDVKFEELLAKLVDPSGNVDFSKIEMEIYRPKETPLKSNGNDVNLEAEVGQMVKNTLRHKAYIRLLKKKYSQMELAMNVK